MGILVFIILGALIGWAASTVTGREHGIFMNLLIGIAGSFVGGYVSRLFTGNDESFLTFNWMGLFWSLIGAVLLLAIANALSSRRHHTA